MIYSVTVLDAETQQVRTMRKSSFVESIGRAYKNGERQVKNPIRESSQKLKDDFISINGIKMY